MSLAADNKPVAPSALAHFFANELKTADSAPSAMASKAVRSFSDWQQTLPDPDSPSDMAVILADWLVWLRVRDLSATTAASYLKALSGLYSRGVKQKLLPPTDAFGILKARLRNESDTLWNRGVTRADLQRMQILTKAIGTQDTPSVAADLLLLSLIQGAMPLAETAMIKAADLPFGDENITAIVRRQHSGSTRQYLFPLHQSRRTPRQLRTEVNALVTKHLIEHDIPLWDSIDDTIAGYWTHAAVTVGHQPHGIARALGTAPGGLPVLGLFGKSQPDADARQDMVHSVSRMFTHNPMRWYAMRLRRRVSFSDLRQRFQRFSEQLQAPEMFYPIEELSRRVGKKIVFEEKPIIRDIVFFRSKATDIAPMLRYVGDLAWCYTTGGPGSAYAPISQTQFDAFQRAIGKFAAITSGLYADRDSSGSNDGRNADGTCSTDSNGDGTGQIRHMVPTFDAGEEVMVIGGSFKDQRGRVMKIESEDPDGIIRYLISIVNDLTTSFTATLDSRLLRPKRQA